MTKNPKAACRIRRLSRNDAEAYREIRLESLHKHPTAFSASFDEERGYPLAWFAERLESRLVLGGETDQGRLVGVAGFYPQDTAKLRHRGILWGMYVREGARGGGVARTLIDGIVDHARRHVEEVGLTVAAGNASAIACYTSAGFSVTGQDMRALKVGNEYVDQLLMSLRFEAGPG